jgi:hypothetical protein
MTELRSHGFGYVPHPVKPSHVRLLELGSREWWAANNNEAVRAMLVAGIHYAPPITPHYKTCPKPHWIDALLDDVAEYERRLAKDDGGDLCIR